jgi:hypothetical protein
MWLCEWKPIHNKIPYLMLSMLFLLFYSIIHREIYSGKKPMIFFTSLFKFICFLLIFVLRNHMN